MRSSSGTWARLILQNAEGVAAVASPQSLEERWILARLDGVRAELEGTWARFDFSESTATLYHLTFDDFCDWYAEAIKPRLYDRDEVGDCDGARRARAAARAASSGHAARDRGDLVTASRIARHA